MGDFAKPVVVSPAQFDGLDSGFDPAERTAAGNRLAHILVRGTDVSADHERVERALTLADDEGLCSIAELWSTALPDTLAGALWRLYVLRTWIHNEPTRASREFTAGKNSAPVEVVLAGVPEPPGPHEVAELADSVIRGAIRSDLDVALDRAAAFAHIVAVGRAHLVDDDPLHDPDGARETTASATRLMETAKQLRQAAKLERRGHLA